MSWGSVPLESVSEVLRGVTFAKSDSSTTEELGTLPVLRAGNIQSEIILDDGLVNGGVYTFHKMKKSPDKFAVNAGCLEGVDPFKLKPAFIEGSKV